MPPAKLRSPALVAAVVLAGGGCAAPEAPLRGAFAIDLDASPAPAMQLAPAPPADPARPAARNAPDAPGALAFVEMVDGHGWLILAAGGDELLASDPALRSDPATGFSALEAKVKLAALDRELHLEGRSFDLYDGDTRLCTVRSGPVRLLGVTSTPFDLLDRGDGPRSASPGELWGYTSRFVAAAFDVPSGCGRATWARLAELPEPRFARARDGADPASAERAAQFRDTPPWREAQQRFDAARASGATSATGAWDDAGASTETVWSAPFTGASWVVRQAVWDEGCGATAALTVAWREAAGATSIVHAADDRFAVEVVLDLDGDGALEMIGSSWGGRELRGFFGTDQGTLQAYTVPEHGCPC